MTRRSWLPHVVLIAVAIAMVAVARMRHTSTDDALRIAFDEEAPSDARIWAAHLAANRADGPDRRLGESLVDSFLSSDDERVREAALMIDLCRHAIHPAGARPDAAPPLQSAYAYAGLPGGEWTPHRVRSLVLFRRKVGGSSVGGIRRMALIEARWFLDSLVGNPLPGSDVIDSYLKERYREPANLRRPR